MQNDITELGGEKGYGGRRKRMGGKREEDWTQGGEAVAMIYHGLW